MALDPKKIVDEVLQELEETTIISTPSGTTKDQTPDQKKQAQDASLKGDTVKIVKKGMKIQEEKDEDTEDHQEPDGDECDDKEHIELSVSEHAAKHIQEAIDVLSKLSESEDKKAQRFSTNTINLLAKAKTALENLQQHENKLTEQKAAEESKAGEKHLKAVEKALAKTIKNKDIVAKIMKKVPVEKAIEMQKKAGKELDPGKVAEAILKVSLKESFDKK